MIFITITLTTHTDYLINGLPPSIVASGVYTFNVPGTVGNGNIMSTCGPVTVSTGNATLSASASLSSSTCHLTILGKTYIIDVITLRNFWYSSLHAKLLKQTTVTATINTKITSIDLPSPSALIGTFSYQPRVEFSTTPSLPTGIKILNGQIVGTPTVLGTTTVTVIAYDMFSGVSIPVNKVQFVVSNPAASIVTTIIIPVIAAIIGLALIIWLIVWFRRRQDRKKLFHIFISYRVATDAKLAEQACFQLQQRFLSTGHRVT